MFKIFFNYPVKTQDVELSEDNVELFSEIQHLKNKIKILHYIVYVLILLSSIQGFINCSQKSINI